MNENQRLQVLQHNEGCFSKVEKVQLSSINHQANELQPIYSMQGIQVNNSEGTETGVLSRVAVESGTRTGQHIKNPFGLNSDAEVVQTSRSGNPSTIEGSSSREGNQDIHGPGTQDNSELDIQQCKPKGDIHEPSPSVLSRHRLNLWHEAGGVLFSPVVRLARREVNVQAVEDKDQRGKVGGSPTDDEPNNRRVERKIFIIMGHAFSSSDRSTCAAFINQEPARWIAGIAAARSSKRQNLQVNTCQKSHRVRRLLRGCSSRGRSCLNRNDTETLPPDNNELKSKGGSY